MNNIKKPIEIHNVTSEKVFNKNLVLRGSFHGKKLTMGAFGVPKPFQRTTKA